MKSTVQGLTSIPKAFLPLLICFLPLQIHAQESTSAVAFARDGHLKMLYDNRSEDKRKLNRYGWGERIEEWISEDDGATWAFNQDFTPVKGYRYQNLKRVSTGISESSNDIVLFYGWKPDAVPGEAVAFLSDDR